MVVLGVVEVDGLQSRHKVGRRAVSCPFLNLTRRDLSKFVSMLLIDTLTHTSPSKHVKCRET